MAIAAGGVYAIAMIRSLWLTACIVIGAGQPAFADQTPTPNAVASHEDKSQKLPADLSGRKRVGKASFYAKRFAGHKMADGAPMQPKGDNAASKTLPLDTTAKVTNVTTGKSARRRSDRMGQPTRSNTRMP